MATNAEIQKFVQRHHGFIPRPEWLAHVKSPPEHREAIEEALRHFDMM